MVLLKRGYKGTRSIWQKITTATLVVLGFSVLVFMGTFKLPRFSNQFTSESIAHADAPASGDGGSGGDAGSGGGDGSGGDGSGGDGSGGDGSGCGGDGSGD